MKEKIHIKWMHCISCEILLTKKLSELEWFKIIKFSHKSGVLEAQFNNSHQIKQVIKIIEEQNFTAELSKNNSDNKNDISQKNINKNNTKIKNNLLNNKLSLQDVLMRIISILLIGIILFILSLFIDTNQFLPTGNNLNFSATFLMWLIASISTCLAVTGWIIIWYSKIISSQTNSFQKNIYTQVWFQIWRIWWFFILWGILWLLWKTFSINLQVTTILTLLVSFLLIYMWLQILKFVPNITKLWVHFPKKFAHFITGFNNPKFSPIIWMLTFFLPCGFTQTAQLIAISSWDFLTGGLIMWAFALGTFPVLFLVWLWTSFFSWKKFPIIEIIIWTIILLFGLNTLVNASNLIPSLFPVDKIIQEEKSLENLEYETIYFKHNGWNIIWNSINLKSWKNYKVIITPERNWMWCMWTLTIPTLSSEVYRVQAWIPIIYDLVNTKVWTHQIVCSSMWMVQWAIIIK